jgi:hypothetical protein
MEEREEELREDEVPEPPNDLEGPEEEPPHLERGSPHENEPAPDPEPPRDIP